MPFVLAQIAGCGGQHIVVDVVYLACGVGVCSRKRDSFSAVDDVGQGQQIVSAKVEEERPDLQADTV